MGDFGSLTFIQLESTRGQETFTGFENDSLNGIACIRCKDGCPGFTKHPWRRGCGNCKCATWEHDIPADVRSHPFDRMCVEESLPPLTSEYDTALCEGYFWVPRGLTGYEIEKFMGQVPNHKVPRRRTPGACHRARQIFYQIPRQDFSTKHLRFNRGDGASDAFDDLSEKRMKSMGIGAVVPRMRNINDCSGCYKSIMSGTMGVYAEKAGKNNCWHVGCFTCAKCDELLADLVYCYKEGKLYCPRHWAEVDKPRCGNCEEIIFVGDYTEAMDKAFHIEHFACSICDQPMTGKKYIVHGGKPVCQGCFKDKLANVCFQCRKPIGPESRDMYVKDRHYHKECLRCSTCSKQLESKSFVLVNGQLVCNDCRGSETPDRCSGCDEEFADDEKKIGIKETNECYHERCFKCDVCKEPIGVKKFVKKPDGVRVCGSCFEETLKLCARCGEAIRGAVVTFDNKPFHSECFDCTNCHRQLAGKPFYRHEEGLYCDECYLHLHAKRCGFCHKAIEGNTKFVDYNNEYFHNDCFTCSTCYTPLAGAKFVVRDGQKLCTNCK